MEEKEIKTLQIVFYISILVTAIRNISMTNERLVRLSQKLGRILLGGSPFNESEVLDWIKEYDNLKSFVSNIEKSRLKNAEKVSSELSELLNSISKYPRVPQLLMPFLNSFNVADGVYYELLGRFSAKIEVLDDILEVFRESIKETGKSKELNKVISESIKKSKEVPYEAYIR